MPTKFNQHLQYGGLPGVDDPVDIGIRNQLTSLHNTDYGHVLAVDFIATKPEEKIYYQVAATIMDEHTRERELKPLQSIPDNYPKYILTMDQSIFNDYSGIKVKNIIDFLLE